MGVERAPVVGSGDAPAWMARVSKPRNTMSGSFALESLLSEEESPPPLLVAASPPPLVCEATPTVRLLLEMTPELKPCQPSSPKSRLNSIFGHRSCTTLRPAASALAAASALRTPSCIHTIFAPICMASSVIGPAASEFLNTSTMSIGTGMDFKSPYTSSPKICLPTAAGFTGMTR